MKQAVQRRAGWHLVRRAGQARWRAYASTLHAFLQPVAWFEKVRGEFGFRAAGFGLVIVTPGGQWRQRHENGLRATAGLQPEQRAAIVDEVEFDVAATAVELERAFALTVGRVLAAGDDGGIG